MNAMSRQLSTLQTGRARFIAAGTVIAILLLAVPYFRFGSSSSQPSALLSSHQLGPNGYPIHEQVTNATLGFERIFVVNLPERVDKKDAMSLQAAVSGMQLDFIDGVKVDFLQEKILPIHYIEDWRRTWAAASRAHVNAIGEVVRRNLTSVLIMEDDIDWDVRLKDTLRDIAISTSVLTQSQTGSEMILGSLPPTGPPKISPYGDDWDVLWLGHCGSHFDWEAGHVLKFNDDTVAQPQYLHSWDPAEVTPLINYPNHTRAVGRLNSGICSLAYAVSQQGARKILFDMGINYLDMGYDLMLGAFCEGSHGRTKHKCYGTLPPVFEHYRRPGAVTGDSDLGNVVGGPRTKGFTMNLRKTVALNMDLILEGSTDYREQYPDT